MLVWQGLYQMSLLLKPQDFIFNLTPPCSTGWELVGALLAPQYQRYLRQHSPLVQVPHIQIQRNGFSATAVRSSVGLLEMKPREGPSV